MDDTGGADGHDVTGEHGVVHAESVDRDLALQAGGSGDPGDGAEDETGEGTGNGTGTVRLVQVSTKEIGMTAEPMKTPIMR